MLFYIDLDSLELIKAANDRSVVTRVDVKRGDGALFDVRFVRSGVAEEITAGSVLTFAAKEAKKYDGGAAILHDDFTLSGSGETANYTGSPSLSTEPLDDLLAVDGDDSNDLDYVDLIAEFSWKAEGQEPTSTKTFTLRVNNDVIRGDEDTPEPLPDPTQWMRAPLVLESAPLSYGLTVTGTLTIDFEVPVIFPDLIEASVYDGKPRYADGLGSPSYEAFWDSANARWQLHKNGTAGIWYCYDDVPYLTDGLEWVPYPPADGIPTITPFFTAADQVGQDAIVNEESFYKCVRHTPVRWIGPFTTI